MKLEGSIVHVYYLRQRDSAIENNPIQPELLLRNVGLAAVMRAFE